MPTQKQTSFGPRSTDAEIDRRIGQAMDVLARKPNVRRSELRRLFIEDPKTRWTDKSGKPVCGRTVQTIVARARAELDERARRPKEDVARDVFSTLERDLANPDAKVRHSAARLLCELRGLFAPRVYGQHVVYAQPEPAMKPANGSRQIDVSKLPPALLDQYEAVINAALALPEFAESTTHEPKTIILPDERQS